MRRARKLVSIVAISALLAAPASSMAGSVTVHEEVREQPGAVTVEETRVQTVTVHQEPGPEPNGISMIADFLVARPLGLVATVVGATVYVLALPFAAMAGDIHTPAEMLVAEPARFTFHRPLGAIDL